MYGLNIILVWWCVLLSCKLSHACKDGTNHVYHDSLVSVVMYSQALVWKSG